MTPKSVVGLVIGAAFLILLFAVVAPAAIPWPVTGPPEGQIGLAIWSVRTFDVLVQGLLLLGGALAVLLLLGRDTAKEVGQ